jgi:glycosyltransferase involved in cell wall biosynthesis
VSTNPTPGPASAGRRLRVAVVVQRYGAAISGGAELHARYIAERLARHAQVEVLTTCAADYITWRNELAPGTETINGIVVRRFPVVRERDPEEFGRHSLRVFTRRHSIRDELAWLDAEGPASPALIAHVRAHADAFDVFLFFSFRYYHAYHGVRAVPHKAVLVPTAERDGALGLSIFGPVFRGVRALMYNSFEERALIQAVAHNHDVPGVVVGVGSEIPPHASAARFRQKFGIRERFALYIGRIDENKGCGELFNYYQRYARMFADTPDLVLIGHAVLPVPQHPRIHHLGFVSDQDKFDALAAAELLIMPSYFESLSMVALEAWALGRPVLANGRCDVLKGQCIRSNAGLYYESFAEFVEALRALDLDPALARALGRAGREYFQRHYTWPVIERKYLEMFERLGRERARGSLEPLPGWLARWRRVLPPANEIVDALPKGPVVPDDGRASRGLSARPGYGSRHPLRRGHAVQTREPGRAPGPEQASSAPGTGAAMARAADRAPSSPSRGARQASSLAQTRASERRWRRPRAAQERRNGR